MSNHSSSFPMNILKKDVLLERCFFFKLRWMGRLPGAATGCFSLFLSRLGYAFWRWSSNILKKYVLLERVFFFQVEMDR